MAPGCPGKHFCNGASQNGTCSECWHMPVHGQHSEHVPFCEAPLQKCLPGHPYSFGSIEEWPLDVAVICKPTDRASVLLGSIKAACSLEDICQALSVKVTVVVTMCANEMEIRGAPKDWAQYFQQELGIDLI